MSRPVRIEFPGAIYYITGRCSKGQSAFCDREDRAVFTNILDNVVSRFGWLLHGYVLLDQHYHLVVEVPDANLSRGMRQLNGVYTQSFNRRHDTEGPIFKGRFKSVIFEKDRYLLPVVRHLALNPVRLGTPSQLSRYRWSSHRAVAGVVRTPQFLHTEDILATFGRPVGSRQGKYEQYVEDGVGADSPFCDRSDQVLLGSPKFLRMMQPILHGEKMAKRGPKQARRRRSLPVLFRNIETKTRRERNDLIIKAHVEYSYTLMEIGSHLGLHYTTVSKVISGMRRRG